jgi:hypothetical protein
MPYFRFSTSNYTLIYKQKRETKKLLTRNPKLVIEPQTSISRNPYFGSAITRYILKYGRKRKEDIITYNPEPITKPDTKLISREPGLAAKPQGIIIRELYFGFIATGYILKQGHKREK